MHIPDLSFVYFIELLHEYCCTEVISLFRSTISITDAIGEPL